MNQTTTSPNSLSIPVVSVDPFGGNGVTYFRTSEVTPYIEDGKLHIFEGKGMRRSWGQANVSSEVVPLAENVVKVKVVGWHKHSVGPEGGSYYFVNEGGKWIRRRANHKVVKAALAN